MSTLRTLDIGHLHIMLLSMDVMEHFKLVYRIQLSNTLVCHHYQLLAKWGSDIMTVDKEGNLPGNKLYY